MNNKNKIFLFLIMLIITIIGVGVVSASDINNTDNIADIDSADNSNNLIDNSVVKDNNKVNIVKDNNEKTLKTSYDPYTKTISDDFSGNIYEVDQDSYDNYFDEKGYLNDNVEDGDILDIVDTISDKSVVNINKAVNIISSNKKGMFNNVSIFSFKHEGSYSNMTDVTVLNSKFFVENATEIVINNVNISIINTSIGLGTGTFSIRDRSTYITFANSIIYCENNGGTSLGVIAAAQHCTFVNSTFKGVGTVGNLLYLTSFNVDGEKATNDYNKFINNTIEKNDSASAISYGIGIIGKNNQFINNTINTKGVGLTVQYGSLPTECTDNYFEGNVFYCSSAATFPNGTYINNSFYTSNAMTIQSNTTVTGNRFNNNVTIGNNSNFTNNIVNSPSSNYAVTVNGNNSIVENNGLTSKNAVGDNAVNNKGDNTIQNNDDRKDFRIIEEYVITPDNYEEFFDESGELYIDVDDDTIFYISGELVDKRFEIHNKRLVFKDYTQRHGILINPNILVYDMGQVTLDGLEIYAGDNSLTNIIELSSSNNIINNCTIIQETNGEKAHSVIVREDNNIIKNSRFELNGPSNSVDFYSTPNLASMINLVVMSSNNVVDNNSFIIRATSESGWGTVEAVTFQNDNVDIKNNTITNNVINGTGTDYIYGINFGGYVYDNLINNNSININSTKYVNGIQFMVSPAGNNQIINNKINISAGDNDNDCAYGIVLSSWGGELFENNIIKDNQINVTATQAYGIEAFSSVSSETPVVINTTIENNTIESFALYSMGIATMGTHNNITKNTIMARGYTNQTGSSVDYILPTTAGILMQKVYDTNIYDNYIDVTNGPAIKLVENANNDTIEENILYSTQGTGNDAIYNPNNYNIIIKANYPVAKAEIIVDGDLIYGEKCELNVRIVDENQNILKKADDIIIVSIYDDEKVEIKEGEGSFIFVPEDHTIVGGAYYPGNKYISETENKFELTIKTSIKVDFEEQKGVIGEDLPLIVTIYSEDDSTINEGKVIFYIDDEEITIADVIDNVAKTSCYLNNNWYKKDITITAKYTDSKTYPEATTTMKPTIIIPTEINANANNDIKIGNKITTTFRVLDSISNNIILPSLKSYVNGKEAGSIMFNQQIRALMFSYQPEDIGEYNIKLVYEGGLLNGYTYNYSEYQTTVNVLSYDTTIIINDFEATKDVPTTITADITSDVTVDRGTVTFKDENNNILATSDVTNGQASAQITLNKEGLNTITAQYEDATNKFSTASTPKDITVKNSIKTSKITINPITIIKGETTNIIASITDNEGNNVNGGKVVFKLNGKTLKDENGKVIYIQVADGKASLSYIFSDSQLKDSIVITAVYSGTKDISSSRSVEATPEIQEKTVTLTANPIDAKQNETITINITVKNGDNLINEGKIVVKINGKTLKDANGKVIYAQVVNGIASINYTIPGNLKVKDYTLTAIFTSNNYSQSQTETSLKVTK